MTEIKDNRHLFRRDYEGDANMFVEHMGEDVKNVEFNTSAPSDVLDRGTPEQFYRQTFGLMLPSVVNELKRQSRINRKKHRSVAVEGMAHGGPDYPMSIGIELIADVNKDEWRFLKRNREPFALSRLKESLESEFEHVVAEMESTRENILRMPETPPAVCVRGVFDTHQLPHVIFVILAAWRRDEIPLKRGETLMGFFAKADMVALRQWQAKMN